MPGSSPRQRHPGPFFYGPVFYGPVFYGPVFYGPVFYGPVFCGPGSLFIGPRCPDINGAMKILVIEDDSETADYVAKGLQEAGHAVNVARDGREALVKAVGETFDVAIVDRMLPGVDGKTIVETVRGAGRTTPILFLSAMGEVRHRVEGLQRRRRRLPDQTLCLFGTAGPGRGPGPAPPANAYRQETVLRVAGLELDRLTRQVARDGIGIDLQPREYRLLEYLMQHAGRVVTRTMMLEHVWDYHFDPQTNVIDVHISRLRQKIDKEFETPLLHTVRGAGYSLRAPDPAD